MRVREVNFYSAISSEIILEDEYKYYIEVCYEDSKSIYVYDKELEKLTEYTSTSNLDYTFFVDEHRKNLYQYYKNGDFLVIEEVSLYEPIEIFNYDIGLDNKIIDLFAIDGYILVRYKNGRAFTVGFIYSIEENLLFNIEDRAFLETVGKRIFYEQDDISYMILEESYYSEDEITSIRKSYGNTEFTKNTIVIYDINNLVDELINGKKVTKNILLESYGKEHVSLLGVYDNKIVVFNKGSKNRIIYLSLDDNIGFRSVDGEIDSIVSKGDLLFISKNKEEKEVINKDNSIIYSYKDIEQGENTEVRALISERILVYSNKSYNGEKALCLYDIFTGDIKSFDCDFLMIDSALV